jgi:peroxiredoxin Q/BCP
MAKELKEGDKAPDFTMEADGGKSVSLKDFAGKPLVLYFYPKDDTPGCTTEAIGFSAQAAAFKKAGAAIVGASKDSVKAHDKFRDKHGLKIPLGSDPDGKTIEAYGSWVEKSMYGRQYMGIDRSTFLIDGKGVVRRIWRKVKVKGHIEEVLAAVKAI